MAAVPALVFAGPTTAGLRVASLTLLDRLLVTLQRAGCGPVTVVAPSPPAGLRRAPALGVKFDIVAVPPARLVEATLVAETGLLTNVTDVRQVLAPGGRLTTRAGAALPLAVIPAGTPWAAPAERSGDGAFGRTGRGEAFKPFLGEEEKRRGAPLPAAVQDAAAALGPEAPALSARGFPHVGGYEALAVPRVIAEGVSVAVANAADACAAEREFWTALSSSSDGLVDRWFNRPVGRPFAKLLARTPVTPNQVSVFSILVGLAGAASFSIGGWRASVAGALLFQLSAIIDCMDGDIARSVFKESPLGKWLDLMGDQIVHLGVFVGMAAGLARAGSDAPVAWLAASCVVGAGIALVVVLRGLLRPELRPAGRMQRLIDLTTNRDFSVLVLALALAGRLEWFLWLAAVGAHAFWVAALGLQLRSRRAIA